MKIAGLSESESRVITLMRAIDAHGHGDIRVKITPDHHDVKGGPDWRFKKSGLDTRSTSS